MAGIYIASKTRMAPLWIGLRKTQNFPICSTWIDEAGAGESPDLQDLAERCWLEAANADAFIIYREKDDQLHGGYIELGIALQAGVPIFAVGLDTTVFLHLDQIIHCNTIEDAFTKANNLCEAKYVSR